jgi:outer membrane protein assembly factor BamB
VTRRSALQASVCTIFGVAVAGCSDGTTAPSTSEPTDGPTPSPTNRVEDRTTPDAVQWHFDAGGPIRHALAAAGESVFLPGSDLHALKSEDGTERWLFHGEGFADSTPIARGDTVYFVSGYDGPTPSDYSVYAVDTATGNERWQFALEQFAEETRLAPLAIADDAFYVTSYGHMGGTATYAIDAADGTERWQFGRGSTSDTGAAAGDSLYLTTSNGLFALAADTGEKRWEFPDAERREPVVREGTVFVETSAGELVALHADDGVVAWQFDTNDERVTTWTIREETAVVGTTDGAVYALDRHDGEQRWRSDLDHEIADVAQGSDGVLYVATRNGTVRAIADGSIRWTGAGFPGTVASVTAGAAVYVHTYDSHAVVAIDASDGTEQWRFISDEALTRPVVDGYSVYVGSTGGVLYAFDP